MWCRNMAVEDGRTAKTVGVGTPMFPTVLLRYGRVIVLVALRLGIGHQVV